jgi:PAS domain S-box-containing protein
MALGFDWAEFCLVKKAQLKLIGIRGGEKGIPVMPLDGPGVVVKVAKTKTAMRIPDTRKDSTYVDHEGYDWQAAPTMLSELAVPVIVDDEAIAVLNTESSLLDAFTREDQTLLEILAFHVGAAFRRLKYTEMIRESEERYRTIFETANDAIIIRDLNGRILEVNGVACDRYGYKHEEFLDLTIREISFTEPESAFDRPIEEIRGKDHGAFATIHRRRDGKNLHVEMSSQLIEFKGNLAILSIVRDIDERVKYQQKLRALHEHASSLALAKSYDELVKLTLDAMQFALGFYHAGFEEVDTDFIRIRGGRGMPIAFGDLPLDGPGIVVQAARTKRAIRIADSRTEPDFVDSKVKSSKGEILRMLSELAVPVIVDGSVVAVLNVESAQLNAFSEQDQVLLDTLASHLASAITRVRREEELRRYTEAALRRSEEMLRAVFESVNAGIMIIDPRKHVIVDANPLALKMIGGTRDQVVGSICHHFVCPSDKGHCPITDLGQHVDNSERKLLGIDGKATSILKSVTTILNGEEYLLESFIDITERKRMEEELLKSKRLAAVGEAAAMVGHDLRNPLQTTTSTLYLVKDLLRSGKPNEATQAMDLLEALDEQVYYMDKIVSDLQDYARPVDAEAIETSLPDLIRETIFSVKIPETVVVTSLVEGEPAKAIVNPTLLRRVLVNLILNAIQAMPNGGKLTITAANAEDSAVITVQDTGTGIPTEHMPKLFTPFFTTKAQGQGLGLAVCKRLTEAQGGTIGASSQEGKGSTFTLKLPATKIAVLAHQS